MKKLDKKYLLLLIGAALAAVLVLSLAVLIYRMTSPPDNSDNVAQVAYVSITDQGFVPSEITITRGTSVVWRNETTDPHQIASNPYPERNDLPSLNSSSQLEPSAEYSYTFDKTGTFGYHDYLRPAMSAQVTVVDK